MIVREGGSEKKGRRRKGEETMKEERGRSGGAGGGGGGEKVQTSDIQLKYITLLCKEEEGMNIIERLCTSKVGPIT